MTRLKTQPSAKSKLLDAAVSVIRAQGYAATTVDDLCDSAGVTKGAFFHHFESKEALGVSAAQHFASMAEGLFSSASYRNLPDPVDRLLGYVALRKSLIQGELTDFTCLFGTLVQETYQTHPAIREACARHLADHVAMLESDIAAARAKYGSHAQWSASSLASYMQAVIQGAFILAKADKSPAVATDCLDHLRRYLEALFTRPQSKEVS
jgi:TetR/AcrR family transcriptional regulator, transcriptional repressor for nem operon